MFIMLSFLIYFISLTIFSLVSHPVYYCILLIINALTCSLICYSVFGFSWYPLLFCLVYIGGVYILFVFVSVHSPNSSIVSYWSFNWLAGFLFTILIMAAGLLISYCCISSEFSSFLCSYSEGYFYLCLCLTLLFGFFMLSLIMSVKINHYR